MNSILFVYFSSYEICPDKYMNNREYNRIENQEKNARYPETFKIYPNCQKIDEKLASFYKKFHPFPYFMQINKTEGKIKTMEKCQNPSVIMDIVVNGEHLVENQIIGLQYISQLQYDSNEKKKNGCKNMVSILKFNDVKYKLQIVFMIWHFSIRFCLHHTILKIIPAIMKIFTFMQETWYVYN